MKAIKQKGKRPISIKWKLFVYLGLFTAVILITLWLLQVVFLSDIYRSIKTSEIRDAADDLADFVDAPTALQGIAEEISQENDVCILILRMESETRATRLVSCDTQKSCVIHNIDRSSIFVLYDAAKRGSNEHLQHYRFDPQSLQYVAIEAGEADGDPESMIYARIVENAKGERYLFLLNSIVSPVEATVKTLYYLLTAVSILMILLALALALILSRKITKPIVDISRSAHRLAEGRYDVDFRRGSYREIRELSETLSYASEELSKVDRLRRELIANTSHDLRTPLTMITGYAEVMRDLPGENTPENAQIIIDESRRLTSLVNDMLDISRLESDTYTLAADRFDLTETVRQGMSRYQQLCERDGYAIVFEADRNITVETDRSKLLQAFYNLVNNALTYTGPDKTVTVHQDVYLDPQDGRTWVRLSVVDTGEGIPQEKLSLIWDRYYKIDAAHRRSAQGSGLGLSIVHKLMTLLHGRCGVNSVLGRGSCFWIEIPTPEQESS